MKRSTLEMSVGIFILIGIICVGYLTIKLGQMEILGGNTYTVNAHFTSVTGLKPGASVEMAGVQVGQVESIILDFKSREAVVQLKIENKLQLSDDVIASVKTAGLIGDKYISLSPGGSDIILKPGDRILETESAIDLEALIAKYVFGGV